MIIVIGFLKAIIKLWLLAGKRVLILSLSKGVLIFNIPIDYLVWCVGRFSLIPPINRCQHSYAYPFRIDLWNCYQLRRQKRKNKTVKRTCWPIITTKFPLLSWLDRNSEVFIPQLPACYDCELEHKTGTSRMMVASIRALSGSKWSSSLGDERQST